MTTRYDRDRSGRRAIGWGAAIMLAGIAAGGIAALIPAFSGWRMDPPFGMGWFFVGFAILVSLTGLVLVGYGLVQLGRSRPPKEERRREREEWRTGPWRHRESHP